MHTYTLTPHISFCDAGGRYIFLDLLADRYFCLSRDAEAAFAGLVSGRPPNAAERDKLNGLEARGVLRSAAGGAIAVACAAPAKPVELKCNRRAGTSVFRTTFAAARLLEARMRLRFQSLFSLVLRLRRRKNSLAAVGSKNDFKDLAQIAADFQAAALIVGALDQCLSISFAICDRAIELGIPADLVIGVRPRPFQAHAWVQADGVLINDRVDHVAQFYPILVT